MGELVELSPWDLGLASLLVVALAATTFFLKLGLGRQLLVAGVRMAAQLLLVGLVLKALFATTHPALVALMALVMLLVASREIVARQKHRVRGIAAFGIGTGAMFVSSFTLAVFALLAVVAPEPWYSPRYAIPVLGMLLGNTMNGISLAIDRLTSAAWEQRDRIEQRLMQGEDRWTAIGPIARDSLRSGMMPVVNAMAAAGIVSLPGMMTGQILAGNSPGDAVKYQILIWFLIAAGSGFGQIAAIYLISRRLFDERHRLRLDRLTG